MDKLEKEIRGSRYGIPIYTALFIFASFAVLSVKSERPLAVFIWILVGLGLAGDVFYYRHNSKKLSRLKHQKAGSSDELQQSIPNDTK
jgi:hypothetical protein